MNQKKSIALTTTFVGLVCGFVLTQQQAAAAATNAPDPTTTSMVAPRSTATAKPAEPNQNEQPVNQQTSTQKAVTNTDNVSETVNQNQIPRNQSTGSPATTTAEQTTTVNNNPTASAPTQQAAASSASKANETTQPVSQPTAPAATDPQVETIAQGTWGTSKWEYTHQGADYILHFHAGTLGTSSHKTIKDPLDNYQMHYFGSISVSPEVFNGNWQLSRELTHIIIDPGVKANQNSSSLFAGLYKLQQIVGLANLDTTNVTDMSYMFNSCQNLTSLDLSNFNTINVTDMSWMFEDCWELINLDLSNFNTTNVTDMHDMFYGCGLTSLDLSSFNTSKVTNMSEMFAWSERLTSLDLSSFNTANVTDISSMFSWCIGLISLDLSNFNTTNVTDMREMFEDCRELINLDLSHFNTAKVTNMYGMFNDCQSLTNLNLSNFNTANVTDMQDMFYNCDSLTSLDLSSFNTAKVTNMEAMFSSCSSLTSLDLSNFNTANVTSMDAMFMYCMKLTSLNLSNFDTAKVTDMRGMFGSCTELTSLDISNFDTSKAVDMTSIFFESPNLNHLILGPKIECKYVYLPKVPDTGTRLLGTDRVVASPYWVATSGYQQGHKYTSNDLMELTGRDQVTTYDWDSKPAFTQTTETKTKVRTINLHQPNGQLKTETQTVAVSRPVTINPDGSKTYGAWTTAQWDPYTVPEWAGYQASQKQVPATTVSGDSANTTIDIYYQPLLQNVDIQYLDQGKVVGTQTITGYTGQTLMPNYQAPQGYEIVAAAPATITIDATGHQIIQVQVAHKINNSTEFNALTRTVNIHRPDGTMKTYIQTAVLKRNVYIDGVTGAKTYGAWSTDNWDAIQIPVFAGYTASQDQVAAHQVTGEDSDQTVDVYYTPINTN
ncbi:BspA family leucine-rich repeat surface protein [Bombilactobacillus mellifer]